jgi:acetyl esterase/lipase
MKFEETIPIRWDYQDMAYGADENQNFDIIIPKEKEAHAIVYIHGGAYLTGNKLQYPSFLLDYAKNNIFATIDYRLVKPDNNVQMADILSDVNDALTKITEVSSSHNVAVKDFMLVGHSAGGHIGLLYGYRSCQENAKIKIAACVSLAGPTDFSDDLGWSSMAMWGENLESRLLFLSQVGSRLTGHTIELKQKNWTRQKNYSDFGKSIMDISPITYIKNKTSKVPPTLLVHARGDDQVPYSNALKLKTTLDFTTVPHKLITATGDGNSHMLGGEVYTSTGPIFFENQKWVAEAKKWMEAYL